MNVKRFPAGRFRAWLGSCLLAVWLLPAGAVAQQITMKETLDYINGKLGPCCSVEVIRGVLIAVYKQDGQTVREDQVSVGDLDPEAIGYDATDQIFFINCKGAPSRKCVSRDLPLLDVYRSYARVSWAVSLPQKGADGMKKAFVHMIRMVNDRKYESSEPFE